ncbi:MAG: prepilin-type N-terminal cleavage/methylation domain-containing protein [Nitrosomonadales bacterium]|nr:prepilin-type N-terminal cleavage/methylation domain-containing protein [Nitrosomonadales bacterium]
MNKQKGFTLVELMVVVAIVAILAAVAVPAYGNYVQRGKLTEAMTELAAMRVKLEQYYQDSRTYEGGCTAGTVAPLPTGTKYFTYDCPILTASAFTARATGVAAEGVGDFIYTIDQNNTKVTDDAPADWTGIPANCWLTKQGQTC